MAKPPAFQFYAADFVVDTIEWHPSEIGVYVRLLCYEWANGILTDVITTLATIAGLGQEEFDKAWVRVSQKFTSDGDGHIYNNRLEETRRIQEAHRKQCSNAGKISANIRKTQNDKSTDVVTERQRNSQQKPNSPSSSSSSVKEKDSLHAVRPIAQTAQEIEKLDFVLRLHDPEFSKWMNDVLMLIGEENKLRPHNPFVWKPTCGSIASDFKSLIYKPPDEDKNNLLCEAYNILGEKKNWPEYVKLAIQIMLKASDKKPIHSPYGFVAKLLYKPGDIVSAKTDGPMAKLTGGG